MDLPVADPPPYPRLLGGRLCLDFANAVDPRLATPAWESLGSYADLVGWAAYAGAIGEETATRLRAAAAQRPDEAAAVFAAAIALREALYRLFAAVAAGQEPAAADLDRVAGAYRAALGAARLERGDGGYGWAWPETGSSAAPKPEAIADPTSDADPELDAVLGPDLTAPLWPVAVSAVETLTEGEPRRLKMCLGTGGCGWFFYDGSKNASRRWCSMEGCGSQVKSRRHYARTRG
jgi:predicted RNA-binding Zn ribbon-like protein